MTPRKAYIKAKREVNELQKRVGPKHKVNRSEQGYAKEVVKRTLKFWVDE